MKYLYSFNSHSDFYNKGMVLEDDNVVLCKDTDINKWHGHYHHPPYDAEIEYLENYTGREAIDTGIYGTNTTQVSFETMFFNTTVSDYTGGDAFGSGVINWDHTINTLGVTYNRNNGALFSFLGDNYKTTQLNLLTGTKHTITYSSKGTWVNGVKRQNGWYNNSFQTPHTITAMVSRGYTGLGGSLKSRLYNFSISDNGILVRDLIPVRVGNKGYMYDKVSDQLFGNAGTGNFILGPDIQPIEYLESTGTQYIDTGVIMNQSSSIEIDFQMTDLASTSSIFGGREGYKTKDFSWMYISSEKKIRRNYGTLEKYSGTYDTVRRTYIHNGRNLINNGAIFDTFDSQTFECPVTTYLFSINNNGATINTGKLRIYGCKITGKNKTVNLIPVRMGNVGYMYDRVSGKLFGNSGTGSFTLGPDL